MTRGELLDRVAAVARNNRSGASLIVRQAVQLLGDTFRAAPDAVDEVACALCRAQPSMAPLWNAAALAVGEDGCRAVEHFAQRLEQAESALVEHAIPVLLRRKAAARPPALTLATVSESATVAACLTALARQAPVRVICAEGRPGMEGRRLAVQLAGAGMASTLCTDAGIGAVISVEPRVDAVVVGADAVSAAWFINKCGTSLLLAAAAARSIPVYIAATTDKFIDDLLGSQLTLAGGAAAEVWDDAPAGVVPANPYFERIPLVGAAVFLTDAGPIARDAVPAMCRDCIPNASTRRLAALLTANASATVYSPRRGNATLPERTPPGHPRAAARTASR